MRLISTLFCIAFLGGVSPAQAQEPACLWRELPTVVQARLELAARLKEPFPVAVLNRFKDGGLSALLVKCGFDNSVAATSFTLEYWSTQALYEILKKQLSSLVSPEFVDPLVYKYTLTSETFGYKKQLSQQDTQKLKTDFMDIIATIKAQKTLKPSQKQKDLLLEYIAIRFFLFELEKHQPF